MKKRAYVSGPEAMLAMADEYARTGSRIEEAEMLQQCDAASGENDLLCKAAARYRLSKYGMPGIDGNIPIRIQEILNIAACAPDCEMLQKYIDILRSLRRGTVHIDRISHHEAHYSLILSVVFEIFYYLCRMYRLQGRRKDTERIAYCDTHTFTSVIYANYPVHIRRKVTI